MNTLISGVVGSHDSHQAPMQDQFLTLDSLRSLVNVPGTGQVGHKYTTDELQCLFGLAIADSDSDNLMSKGEYFEYVKFLVGSDVESLPPSLQANFDSFAVNQVIPIVGTNFFPLNEEKQDDMDWLMLLCEKTKQEIVANDMLDNGGTPVPASNIVVSADMLECLYALALADTDRDLLLNQEDFAELVYLLTGFYQDEDYEDFHTMLQATYAFFATSPNELEIDIYGSYYPQQHTDVTESKLLRLQFACKETKQMVWYLNDVSDPTALGATPVSSVHVRVDSDFLVSNNVGLCAAEMFSEGRDWKDIEQAYDMTAQEIVEEHEDRSRQLLSRQLVQYVTKSASVTGVSDIECPQDDDEASCLSVSASFLVALDGSLGLSVPTARDMYSKSMNKAIKDGDLQDNLVAVNPGSAFTVVNQKEGEGEIESQDASFDPEDIGTTHQAPQDHGADVAVILSSVLFGIALVLFIMALLIFQRSAQGRSKYRRYHEDFEEETVCTSFSDE